MGSAWVRSGERVCAIPDTSTSWPGSMRPELGRTQYLESYKSDPSQIAQDRGDVLLWGGCFDLGSVSRGSHGDGARNHTLNATGEELVFLILRTCATSMVKGPS